MLYWKKVLHLFIAILILFVLVATLHASEGIFEKGLSEFKAENYEEALELFEKAYKANPNDPQLIYYLGLTHKEMQNFTEAEKFLKETIKLNLKVSEVNFLLAEVLYNMGNYDEALNTINDVINNNVKPAQSYYLKGLILMRSKRNTEAIEAFKKAAEIDPSLRQQADFQIASIYLQDREFKKAGETFKGLITVDPTSDWALYSKDYLEALEKVVPPYRLNIGVGLQYDDNVLAVPVDESLVDIGKQDDWKRTYSLLGEYAIYSSNSWNVRAAYSLNIVQYSKSDYTTNSGETIFSQDTVTHTVSLMPSYNTEKTVTSLLFSYSYLEVDYTKYTQSFNIKPMYTFTITGNHLGQVYFRYKRDDFNFEYYMIKFGYYPSEDENRDANNYAVGGGYFYTFKDGSGLFNIKEEIEHNDADGANWDYTGIKVSIGLLYPLIANTLKANLFLEEYHQGFSNVHSTYGEERSDDTITAQIFLTYTIMKPLDVSIGYTHINDNSNIDVYKYNKNVYTVSLEYRF
ncbi:MAG: tetratricopeptide repeat protein [Nitrospirota bacterium]